MWNGENVTFIHGSQETCKSVFSACRVHSTPLLIPPQRKENQNKNINHRDSRERNQTMTAECFAQITKSSRRDANHFPPAYPEEYRCDEHGNTGNAKCPAGTEILVCEQVGTEQR